MISTKRYFPFMLALLLTGAPVVATRSLVRSIGSIINAGAIPLYRYRQAAASHTRIRSYEEILLIENVPTDSVEYTVCSEIFPTMHYNGKPIMIKYEDEIQPLLAVLNKERAYFVFVNEEIVAQWQRLISEAYPTESPALRAFFIRHEASHILHDDNSPTRSAQRGTLAFALTCAFHECVTRTFITGLIPDTMSTFAESAVFNAAVTAGETYHNEYRADEYAFNTGTEEEIISAILFFIQFHYLGKYFHPKFMGSSWQRCLDWHPASLKRAHHGMAILEKRFGTVQADLFASFEEHCKKQEEQIIQSLSQK